MEKYVRKNYLTALFIFLALTVAGSCFAAVPPKPSSSIYCQDLAGVLDASLVAQINSISADIQKKSGAQLVVLTVNSLDGMPLEEYSLDVLRQWGIGDKTKNNGVLLLVAVKDRKSRIEVGYGLEGALPDGKTGRIQDDYMLPSFKTGNYSEGVWRGYKALALAVAAEYKIDIGQQRGPPETAAAKDSGGQLPAWMIILGAIVLVCVLLVDWIFFGGMFTMMILAILTRRGGGPGDSGGGFGGGSGGGGGSSRSW